MEDRRQQAPAEFECASCGSVSPVVRLPPRCARCGSGNGVVIERAPREEDPRGGEPGQ